MFSVPGLAFVPVLLALHSTLSKAGPAHVPILYILLSSGIISGTYNFSFLLVEVLKHFVLFECQVQCP